MISFVNVREQAGWSARGAQAMPKIAALLAHGGAARAGAGAGGRVQVRRASSSSSARRDAALDWARAAVVLSSRVSVLCHRQAGELPLERKFPVWTGTRDARSPAGSARSRSSGQQENPIDLELCTRCNACVRACPESAIGYELPGRPGEVQGAPRLRRRLRRDRRDRLLARRRDGAARRFDLVLDLSREPLVRAAPAAAGLFRARRRSARAGARRAAARARWSASSRSRSSSSTSAKICAHSRSAQDRLQRTASTSARAARSAPTAITSRSSRTFAWAAAAARPCARRAR